MDEIVEIIEDSIKRSGVKEISGMFTEIYSMPEEEGLESARRIHSNFASYAKIDQKGEAYWRSECVLSFSKGFYAALLARQKGISVGGFPGGNEFSMMETAAEVSYWADCILDEAGDESLDLDED